MIVYCVTNKINGKIYIGQSTKTLQQRRRKHLKSINQNINLPFYRALKKYGKDNFEWVILKECSSKKELDETEIYYIRSLKSNDEHYGYNRSTGGEGGDTYTDNPRLTEIKETLKKRTTENWKKAEYRDKVIPEISKFYFSSEQMKKLWADPKFREKVLNARKGIKQPGLSKHHEKQWKDPVYRDKMCKMSRDKWDNDPSYRSRISQKMKDHWANPEKRKEMLEARKRAKNVHSTSR
jgi:group I intron endonuclease